MLLTHANLTLKEYACKKDLDYGAYEKMLKEAQNWYMYQQALLNVLYQISELEYNLYLGTVSKEQCGGLLQQFTQQTETTRNNLCHWHQENMKRLDVSLTEGRRKRDGVDAVIHYIPGLFDEKHKFKAIENGVASMIENQISGRENNHQDAIDLYVEDVQLIAKDGKIYYLPATDKTKGNIE